MAVLCSEIWLLIRVVFVLQLPAIKGQICQQGWTFHAPTSSCMALIRDKKSSSSAAVYCTFNSTSNNTRGIGNLVEIYDKATDDFVKGLLDEGNVDRAFIGLHDDERNGDYLWGLFFQTPVNYTGWAVNPHIPDRYMGAVVMTKGGWQEYNWRSPAYFVCQVGVAKPVDIQCSHVFVQKTTRTMCKAENIYPKVGCTWKVKYGTLELDVYNQTSSNQVVSPKWYDGATCNASFSISNAGTYVVAVAMNPDLGTGKEIEIRVSVAPPQQPPQLYLTGQRLESLWVEVEENQALNITCRVPGGDPEVYRTIIKCNNIQQQFESDGSWVTMDVGVTRAFHGQNCTCSALHAATYTQTSSVEIRVTYSKNGGSQAHNVGAIVGVVVAATLAIIIICVLIFLWKNKGALCKKTKHQPANTQMNGVDKIDESGSRHVVEELTEANAPENPQ